MLYGFDISHHNGSGIVTELIRKYPNNTDFFMIKATEGKSFIDHQWRNNATSALLSKNGCVGLYHFCRPDAGNTPEEEAHHFCNTVSDFVGKAILAADYEDKALSYGQDWLLQFCTRVFEITGVRPIIYIQYSEIKKYPKIAENNFGLWLAKWGDKPDNVLPWKFTAIWQTTNKFNGEKLDSNIFFGDSAAWTNYCLPIKDVNTDIPVIEESENYFEKAVVEILKKYKLL